MELGKKTLEWTEFRCFLLYFTLGFGLNFRFNTGSEPVISDNGLLTTVGFAFPGQKPVYALEGISFQSLTKSGSIAVAGSAVKWARDQLGIIKSSDEIGKLALNVQGIHQFIQD
jgi:glycerol kinase